MGWVPLGSQHSSGMGWGQPDSQRVVVCWFCFALCFMDGLVAKGSKARMQQNQRQNLFLWAVQGTNISLLPYKQGHH